MLKNYRKRIVSGLLMIILLSQVLSYTTLSTKINPDLINHDDIDVLTIPSCGAYLLPKSVIPNEEPTSFAPTPKTWDWSDATYNGKTGNWLTSVKKQGDCGSCWAFAAIGALEAMVNIQRNNPDLDIDLSEQQLVSCCRIGCNGCHGGNSYTSWEYLMNNGGSILEECFPYQGIDSNGCHSWKTDDCSKTPVECEYQCDNENRFSVPIKRTGYYQNPDFNLIKDTIYNKGPVVTFMLVYSDFNYYSGGIYRHDPNSDIIGGHAVIITGYDDNEDYLICKNSWGEKWGENGFFRIPLGESMLGGQIYFVEVDIDNLNFPPQADAGSRYAADIGESIQFNGDGSIDQDDNIISYHWDFGDGTTSTEQNPAHFYNQKGIYPVTLTVVDVKGLEDTDQTTAYIDIWDIGDMWTYNFQLETIPDALYPPIRLPMDISVDELTMMVVEETAEAYVLELTGSLRGNLSFVFDTENTFLDFKVWGNIKRGTIQGTLTISKKGCGVDEYHINIRGFSQFLGLPIIPIPIYVPLPFLISLSQSFEQPKSIIGVYPEVGNHWSNPAINSSLEMVFSSMLGLISKSFENNQIKNEPQLFTISDFRTVSTSFGNYPCYQLTSETNSQINTYYYSTDLWNYVKIDILDPELFNLTGEIITSNYS